MLGLYGLNKALSYSGHKVGGGAMVLGKLQCRGILLIWFRAGQGHTALAVGAGGVVWTFFLSSITSLFFLPLSGRRSDIDCITVSKGR